MYADVSNIGAREAEKIGFPLQRLLMFPSLSVPMVRKHVRRVSTFMHAAGGVFVSHGLPAELSVTFCRRFSGLIWLRILGIASLGRDKVNHTGESEINDGRAAGDRNSPREITRVGDKPQIERDRPGNGRCVRYEKRNIRYEETRDIAI